MAQIDDAALVASGGHIFVAPVGTAKPEDITDPTNPGEDWETIGHTSLDEMPEVGRDGDDPTTLGSWQNSKLKVITPDVTYSLTFNSIQASSLTYQMYFGAGPEKLQADGGFRIPARPVPQEKALLMVIVDGANYLPMWHPRVSLLGSDAVSTSAEEFVTFPITGTLLAHPSIGGDLGEWLALGA
ncbi:hypothetical protein E0L36_26625 [Streptomyces sp. AJS327]|uniref:phage tail tube protein n=1 Tax=Streptomyces sp. AJS327 TaxID=2545265 RepID=UPI0015DFFF44|nr:hypothetical protein [Streptomyces sp. AJS327]MBA0054296.1 hypothetical protein [Streptomyces sp. AJS327]